MGSLGFWRLAEADPDWIAAIDPDGTEHRAGDLLARANQLVHALRGLGLTEGDGIASLVPNGVHSLELYLAALQAGWYLTPINWHFEAPEIAYIVADSDAKALFVGERFADKGIKAVSSAGLSSDRWFSFGTVAGFTTVDDFVSGQPTTAPDGRTAGATMHYTSGTTGKPKGVKRKLSGLDPDDSGELMGVLLSFFGIPSGRPNVHLVTSPNYHTAVNQFGSSALQIGHTVVYMDRFDAEATLQKIERYKCTNTHMVPTQFKRLLSLPEDVRSKYDVSSMQWAIHAAAPCPVPVKQAMLDWWGDCIYEYYAATEGGGTIATPTQWRAHPGTVGSPWPISEVKIFDDEGNECAVNVPGTVYMKMMGVSFEYKGDPEKTKANRLGDYFTVGDIGYIEENGYLFLCDRKADMIISGGVNIYPAEIESELLANPKVADAAVFGIPDEDWGEQIKAVIEPASGQTSGPALAAEILQALEGRLAKLKWPKSIDFVEELPRDPNGKLQKRTLRAPYWEGRDRAI